MANSNVLSVAESTKLTSINVPHYVPGRKLTSDDLQHERDAALKHLEIVGRGVGTGVIEGLWVAAGSVGSNQLTVSAGTGINRTGHPIVLETSLILNLLPTTTQSTSINEVFGPCKTTLTVNTGKLQDGPYLLTAIPVSSLSKEMTTAERILPTRKIEDCTNLWEEETINFRVIFLGSTLFPEGFNETTDANLRRNMLAHWAFGTEKLLTLVRDPFNRWGNLDYSGFGPASKDLTDCDLRLAVFYLETDEKNVQSTRFVDNWAVRRRPYQPSQFPLMSATSTVKAGIAGWSQRVNDQLSAEGEARFAQFQEHLDLLTQQPNMASWAAKQYFGYLPAAGYIPLQASPKLIKVISEYMVSLLEEEIKKSSANPQNSQLSDDNSISQLSTDTGHVTRDQMDGLILQFNTIFTNIVSVSNRLALTESLSQIYLPSIDKLKPNNLGDAVTTWEVDTNDHVLDTTFNGRLITAIDARVIGLATLITSLGVNFNAPLSTEPLPKITGEPGLEDRLHINVNVFNTSFINILNTRLTEMVTALNTIIAGRSIAWTAVNNNLDQIMNDLKEKLKTRLSTTFVSSNNGVALESFFTKDSTTNTTYVKYLAFTDRQAIETLLRNSWCAPAISLKVDQKLSLVMVYEDVIPDAVEQMKFSIETDQFPNRDSLYKVWSVDVDTVFNRIITNKSGSGKPSLYGLFTQAIYPLQMTVWQETAVISEPPSDNNPPPVGGNNGGVIN